MDSEPTKEQRIFAATRVGVQIAHAAALVAIFREITNLLPVDAREPFKARFRSNVAKMVGAIQLPGTIDTQDIKDAALTELEDMFGETEPSGLH
jgi:hypothetical protein